MVPRDPLYAQQWHFGLIGDIEAIWRDYRGTGVVIGLNDDRPDFQHADLDRNIDPALGLSSDDFGSEFDAHGTAVAGIMVAEANGRGGVGVAPDARMGWISYYYEGYDASLSRTVNFDVVNNSWGVFPGFATSDDLSDPNSIAAGLDAHLRIASETGRGGLGSISVHAAGKRQHQCDRGMVLGHPLHHQRGSHRKRWLCRELFQLRLQCAADRALRRRDNGWQR